MEIVRDPWKLNNLCRSQHRSYFFMCGGQITFPSRFSGTSRQRSRFFAWELLKSLSRARACSAQGRCFTHLVGMMMHLLSWLPFQLMALFLSSRKSPRGCCDETLREDYTAAHCPMNLGCQPPTWAHVHIPA